MTDTSNPLSLFLFILANVLITAGYVFLALGVVPRVDVKLLRTKIGGIGFFLLCGMTHLNMAWMAMMQDDSHTYSEGSTSWLMLAIHIPQAICVWLFVTGVYIEIGDFGLLRTKEDAQRKQQALVEGTVEDGHPLDHL